MYRKILELKSRGISKSQIARELNLDRKTVRKYYQMTPKDFHRYRKESENRHKDFQPFKSDILKIYEANGFRKLNMSAIYDRLEEEHGRLPRSERSLRNYINFLIMTGQLHLKDKIRLYQQVPELEYGRQMQVDFGEYVNKSGLKLYIFAALLSASRYRYVAFQSRPFRTKDVIGHLLDAFDYIGGLPQELVIDQDSILVVSENKGDIIYTKDFKTFIDEMSLSMYVCRKADPESKGKIENLIKFVKYNFLNVRDFSDIESAQESLFKWLSRRANGKISHATNRIPSDALKEEREHLRPLRNSIFRKESFRNRDKRKVSRQSFIMVSGNEYSVPVKYRNRYVDIYETEKLLFVFDSQTGVEVARHEKSPLKGRRMAIKGHFREKEKTVKTLSKEVSSMFSLPEWGEFLRKNRELFSRYSRDQFGDAKRYFKGKIDAEVLKVSLMYCIKNKTYSYKNLKDSYDYFFRLQKDKRISLMTPKPNLGGLSQKTSHPPVSVEKRNLNDYKEHIESLGAFDSEEDES